MKDWLKQKYPRLTDAELDQLVETIDGINGIVGQVRTSENYKRLNGLADQLKRILGPDDALKLSLEMQISTMHKGHA